MVLLTGEAVCSVIDLARAMHRLKKYDIAICHTPNLASIGREETCLMSRMVYVCRRGGVVGSDESNLDAKAGESHLH